MATTVNVWQRSLWLRVLNLAGKFLFPDILRPEPKSGPGKRCFCRVETSDFSLPAFHLRLFFFSQIVWCSAYVAYKIGFLWKCAANKLCTAIVSRDRAALCRIKLTMTQLLLVNINVHNSTSSALLHSLVILLL
jgi:hypothetical protein